MSDLQQDPRQRDGTRRLRGPGGVGRRTGARKVLAAFTLMGAAVLIIGFALQELKTRGTQGVSGITVANFKAEARVDGRPAPEFELPTLNGDRVGLDDFAGEVVVLNFWASWCAPCRLEAADLERVWESYRDRDVQFLGVNYRDDKAAARAFVDEFALTYPSVYDPAGRLAFDYQLQGLPTTFVIGRDGRIMYRFIGYIDSGLLRAALDEVLRSAG